jgi:hypothetical protein
LVSTDGSTAHAIYRLVLAGKEPGALSVDANVTTGAGYYIGLADYGNNRWQWAGPFTEHHTCFDLAQDLTGGHQ